MVNAVNRRVEAISYLELLSSLVGEVVEVKQWKDPEGKIFINGETWNAKSDVPPSSGFRLIALHCRNHDAI